MAEISAGLVKELREKTGAGMMDCKRALTETQGDLEGAVDWLRKKGLSAAAKKGVVVVRSSRVGSGAVVRNVELNDDQLGTVAAQELNPSKARVLLQLALTKTKDPVQIQKMFYEY